MDNQPLSQLEHSRSTIARLFIGDSHGKPYERDYKMKSGVNTFTCYAVHIDGYTERFKAIWTCPVVYACGNYDLYGTLGNTPKETVQLNSLDTCRYTQLVCWAYAPSKESLTGNSEIPHYNLDISY